MKIDLKKIPIHIINLKKDEEKLHDILLDLKEHEFTNINVFEAIHHEIREVGCASSHMHLLRSLSPPFILLEDDCVINNDFYKFEIPDNADAVYLGVSRFGYHNDTGTIINSFCKDFVFYQNTNMENLYKIENMLSAHAILYLSKEYVAQVIRVCNFFIKIQDHFDKGIAENMKYFNVFALGDPVFYQKSSLFETKIKLFEINQRIYVKKEHEIN